MGFLPLILIKPLKETSLGVAQPFLTPKETILNSDYLKGVSKTN